MTPVLLRLEVIVSAVRRDTTSGLEYLPAVELDNDLAVAVVIDLLELANVA